MSYNKQNFTDGQVLKASHLNHIEEGIYSKVRGAGIRAIVKLTQEEYDAMALHDDDVLYVIEE